MEPMVGKRYKARSGPFKGLYFKVTWAKDSKLLAVFEFANHKLEMAYQDFYEADPQEA